jgi:hypothetical protein
MIKPLLDALFYAYFRFSMKITVTWRNIKIEVILFFLTSTYINIAWR